MTPLAAEPLLQQGLVGEALDGAPVLVFVADDEMRLVAVNDFACRTLGYTRAELLASRITDVAVYDAAPEEFDELRRGVRSEGTSELRRKDGETVVMRYRTSETRVYGLPFYVSIGWIEPT